MNRSEFLKSILPLGLEQKQNDNGKPKKILRTNTGIEKYTGAWGTKQAEHLLRRLTFGAKKSDVTTLANLGMDGAVNLLLTAAAIPTPPTSLTTGLTFHDKPYDSTNDSTYRSIVKSWWTGLMLTQSTSITEKLTLFWHNHLVSQMNTVSDSRYMYNQLATLHSYSLGNIKELIKAITKDPAMLRYLNGNTNISGKPNENYGRELQELFTIGKGPEIAVGNYTNYTEADVKAAAQVLTGWKDVSATVTSTFDITKHDKTDKQFSTDYKSVIVKGKTDSTAGDAELNDLIEMIFAQTETAKYFCRKLYRWFIYYQIDASEETNVIEPLANILRTNNYNIKPVLDTLFKSAHFFDENNMSCIIKNPMDFIIGVLKDLELTLPDPTTQKTSFYLLLDNFRSWSINLQMDILDPPEVAGWAPYYQAPDYHELWINTVTLPTRHAFTDALITGISVSGFKLQFDTIEYTKKLSNPTLANDLVSELTSRILGIDLTQTQIDYLVQNVLMPSVPSYEWTNIWNDYLANPTNTTKKKTVADKLNALYKFIMRMSEYELS